jgi:hypothetical protein
VQFSVLNSTLINHGTINVEGALLVFDRRRSTMSQALPPYESYFVNRAGGRINMRDPSQLRMHWVQFDNYGVFNITRGTVNVSGAAVAFCCIAVFVSCRAGAADVVPFLAQTFGCRNFGSIHIGPAGSQWLSQYGPLTLAGSSRVTGSGTFIISDGEPII